LIEGEEKILFFKSISFGEERFLSLSKDRERFDESVLLIKEITTPPE
jgi:hypothetical protein